MTSVVGPSATMSPSAITTTRSAARATNSTSWVEMTTARPSAARSSTMRISSFFAW